MVTSWYEGTKKLPSAPSDAGSYTFVATVAETDMYLPEEVSQTVTINTAEPTAIAPTAEATYGQTLADVTLTNPEGNTPGIWTWMDGTTGVGSVGTRKFKANFTPRDEANYNAKQDVDVTVTVLRAANPATVTNEATVVSGGNTIDLAKNVERNGATGSIHYAFAGEANGCTLNGSMLTSGDSIGSTTVNVTVAEDDNYNALDKAAITVTIKGTQTIDAPDVTCAYGDTDKSVVASVTDPATGGGALSFAVKDGSEDYLDVDATTSALTLKKVGTAFVVVTAAETSALVPATKEVTVTINKADAVPATITANDRTYDATERPLVTVTGEPVGGSMRFALGTDGTTEPDASAYTDSIPTATNAGTYHVWYKVAADANHNDTDAACVDVTVARATITSDDVTIDTPQVTFDGKEHGARVTVRLGDIELFEDDYEVSGTLAATDAGDYTVNVTGTGNYEGTATATWEIVPATHDNVALSMEASPEVTTAELDLTPYLVADATCGVTVIEGSALAGAELAGNDLTITFADVEAGASAAIRLTVTSNNYEAYEIGVNVSVRDKTTNVVLGALLRRRASPASPRPISPTTPINGRRSASTCPSS